MTISLKTHKILWGKSGNKSAICKNSLIVDPSNPIDDPSIVGDEAHIIARSGSFSRGDYDSLTQEQKDQYSNLILLCKTHHKQIDDQQAEYTVDRLREIKALHEREVAEALTEDDNAKQQDDIIYSGYVDEWQRRADLDNWRNVSSWLSAGSPALPRYWYDSQKQFLTWIIGRIWSNRYPLLEKAMFNYTVILQDLLNVFDKHIDHDIEAEPCIYTERFYKKRMVDEDRYQQLLKEYNVHECLVNDLFFELTRAGNYICDRVREFLFRGYRMEEGALLIERHCVGFGMKDETHRVEYRNGERIEVPYPGLKQFKAIRYTRDYALDPKDPEPPRDEDRD